MSDLLYLYTSPYLITDNLSNRQKYIEDISIDDSNSNAILRLNDMILKFIKTEGLVTVTSDGRIVRDVSSDTGSMNWIINVTNFRTLTHIPVYRKILSALAGDDKYNSTVLLDLHARIGCMIDHTILNTIVNRVMISISNIPFYDADMNIREEYHTWEDVHLETPFIWLMIYIQALLRTEF